MTVIRGELEPPRKRLPSEKLPVINPPPKSVFNRISRRLGLTELRCDAPNCCAIRPLEFCEPNPTTARQGSHAVQRVRASAVVAVAAQANITASRSRGGLGIGPTSPLSPPFQVLPAILQEKKFSFFPLPPHEWPDTRGACSCMRTRQGWGMAMVPRRLCMGPVGILASVPKDSAPALLHGGR